MSQSKVKLLYNPPHSGEVLKELCIEPLNLTVTEVAEALGVTLKTLPTILNGKANIGNINSQSYLFIKN